MRKLKIKSVEVHSAEIPLSDLGTDESGFSLIYEPGGTKTVKVYGIRLVTNGDVTGEYVGGDSVSVAQFAKFADYLIGRDPLQRELVYNDVKRCLRKFDKMGLGLVDLALWDLAGKAYGASVSELLGGWRTSLPAYASTMSGDRNGGLDSPQAYADFARRCAELGYRGFKLHTWEDYTLGELAATVEAVRDAVGPTMHLMLDPANKLHTWMEAMELARVCDTAGFLWLEDLYRDGGVAAFGHRLLRERSRTPLLQTEHIRGPEAHADFILAGGTDLVRVDAEYDGGITGAVKIAHFAESLGLDVEIHGPGPAHRQLMAALRNTNYYEMSLVHPKTQEIGRCQLIYADDYRDGLESVAEDGTVPVPRGPGLGVQYDWDFIHAHTVGLKVYGDTE